MDRASDDDDAELARLVQQSVVAQLCKQDAAWQSPEFPAALKVSARYHYARYRGQLLAELARDGRLSTRNPLEDRRDAYQRAREALLTQKSASSRASVRQYLAPSMSKAVGAVAKSRARPAAAAPAGPAHALGGLLSDPAGILAGRLHRSSAASSLASSAASASSTSSSAASPGAAGPPRRTRKPLADVYAFAGMHCVLSPGSAVTAVQFCRSARDLLAVGTADGALQLVHVGDQPRLLCRVAAAHSAPVTDVDWSLYGDRLLSVALDRTVKVWRIDFAALYRAEPPDLLRSIKDEHAVHAARFHPYNSNLLLFGNQGAKVHQFNVSTGRVSPLLSHAYPVSAIAFDLDGEGVFVGDAAGHVLMFDYIPGRPLAAAVAIGSLEGAVCSIAFKPSLNDLSRGLVLAVARSRRMALWERSRDQDGAHFALQTALTVPVHSTRVRAVFCPMVATSSGVCVCVGGDDGGVHILNAAPATATAHAAAAPKVAPMSPTVASAATARRSRSASSAAAAVSPSTSSSGKHRPSSPAHHSSPSGSSTSSSRSGGGGHHHNNRGEISKAYSINDLWAHMSTVLDVAWSDDESLLASGDAAGTLIVWKRTARVSPDVRDVHGVRDVPA